MKNQNEQPKMYMLLSDKYEPNFSGMKQGEIYSEDFMYKIGNGSHSVLWAAQQYPKDWQLVEPEQKQIPTKTHLSESQRINLIREIRSLLNPLMPTARATELASEAVREWAETNNINFK